MIRGKIDQGFIRKAKIVDGIHYLTYVPIHLLHIVSIRTVIALPNKWLGGKERRMDMEQGHKKEKWLLPVSFDESQSFLGHSRRECFRV